MPTDLEILEDPISDTKEKIRALARLFQERSDEHTRHLQDVTQDVQRIKELQTAAAQDVKDIKQTQKKQFGWSITLSKLWKKVIAFLNSEIHKISLDE